MSLQLGKATQPAILEQAPQNCRTVKYTPRVTPCSSGQTPRVEVGLSDCRVMSHPGSLLFLHRCLAEGAGDVAFVKHSTVLENTDGEECQAQLSRLTPDGLQYYGTALL